MTSASELRAALREAEKNEANEAEARRLACQPVFTFTMLPHKGHDTIRDETVENFYLARTCVNRESCLAAGWHEDSLSSGGMQYLFNRGTGKIICRHGGGYALFGGFSRQDEATVEHVYQALERFLVANSKGGDVTSIIPARTYS